MRERKVGMKSGREKGRHTLTHTQMRWEILEGGRFCGHVAHLMLVEREREKVRAEGDTWVRGKRRGREGGCRRENYKTCREAMQRSTSGKNRMIIHSNTSTACSSNIISARFTHTGSCRGCTHSTHPFTDNQTLVQKHRSTDTLIGYYFIRVHLIACTHIKRVRMPHKASETLR